MSFVILNFYLNISGRLNYHREISALTTNDKSIFYCTSNYRGKCFEFQVQRGETYLKVPEE
jgi:hypothetical protein